MQTFMLLLCSHSATMPAQGAALCCCALWEPLGCTEAGLDPQAVLPCTVHAAHLPCFASAICYCDRCGSDGTLDFPQQRQQQQPS